MSSSDLRGSRLLMERVARGDRAAARKVFERHGDAVYRYVRGMGLTSAAAEDVAQDVFLIALAKASSYRGEGSLEGWLVRVARRIALDRSRSESARVGRERAWVEEQVRVDPGAPGDGDRRSLLSRLLLELEPEDREIIVLARFLEFGSDRVGEILDISAGAARVRLHRALGRLAKLHANVEAS